MGSRCIRERAGKMAVNEAVEVAATGIAERAAGRTVEAGAEVAAELVAELTSKGTVEEVTLASLKVAQCL